MGQQQPNIVSKIFFNILGTFCVMLGIAGIILPLMPATPFLLLAAACYIRGSERLYNKLMSHRVLGPYIRNIRENRGMPLKAKVYAIILLWISLLFSAYRLNRTDGTVALILVGLGVTILILRVKTLQPEPTE